ncbi:MAG TPA: M48 family metallopeptidase [bacterium]|nr:M48 family metallopeptidase [bacterium]
MCEKSSLAKNSTWLTYKYPARKLVRNRLDYYNQFYQFKVSRISIRNQRTRWGSCSAKGNLNFNYRIVLLPEKLADYIIVHELCHLKEFNHSADFWALVAQALPDFRQSRSELKKIKLNSLC